MSNREEDILNRGWAQMSKTLDHEIPKSKNKRPLLLLAFMAAVLVIGMIKVYNNNLDTPQMESIVAQLESVQTTPIQITTVQELPVYTIPVVSKSSVKTITKTSVSATKQEIIKVVPESKSVPAAQTIVNLPSILDKNDNIDVTIEPIATLEPKLSIETTLEKRPTKRKSTFDNPNLVNTKWGLMTGILSTDVFDIERLSVGLFYNIGYKKWSTELGFTYDIKTNQSLFNDNNGITKNVHYFKLPLLVEYSLTDKVYLNTGVESYVAYQANPLNSESALTGYRINNALLRDNETHFGCVSIAGLGFHVTDRLDVNLRYGYQFLRLPNDNQRNHQASFNIKYYIK